MDKRRPTPRQVALFGILGALTFAAKLEKACIDTIEGGTMTKDLAALWEKEKAHVVTSDGFLAAVRTRLERSL